MSMEAKREDWLLNEVESEDAGIPWWQWALLWIAAAAVVALQSGCDGEAAQVTAYAEQEAHQRHVDSLLAAGWVKYQSTVTPIRASDLGATITVCQQIPDRQWECLAK